MKDLLLLFPPQWSPFQPPLSIATLSAVAKQNGFSVNSVDLNISFYHWLLSDEASEIAIKTLQKSKYSTRKRDGIAATLKSVATFREDVHALNHNETENESISFVEKHRTTILSLCVYLRAISDSQNIFEISPFHFKLKEDGYSSHCLEKNIDSPPTLLVAFFNQHVLPRLLDVKYKTIGISCLGLEQLFFTLYLGLNIKKHVDSPIIIGGSVFTRIIDKGTLNKDWFGQYFDAIVRYEGEKSLVGILENITKSSNCFNDVEGVSYFDIHKREILHNKPPSPIDLSQSPLPDFDDLLKVPYLSSDTVLPILASRGCYWGKCSFCNHGLVYNGKHRKYTIEQLESTVRLLSEKYGTSLFAFNDEAIPPSILKRMSTDFPHQDTTNWSFTGLLKAEKNFDKCDFQNAYNVGFRSLYIGLESASDRVLEKMNKHLTKEIVLKNLQDASSANIWTHCFVIVGFPSESIKEANYTRKFIIQHSDIIDSVGASTFALEHGSEVMRNHNHYGITNLESKEDLFYYYDYSINEGITNEIAYEIAQSINKEPGRDLKYKTSKWVHRDNLLCLLSKMDKNLFLKHCYQLDHTNGLGISNEVLVKDLFVLVDHDNSTSFLIDKRVGRVVMLSGNTRNIIKSAINNKVSAYALNNIFPGSTKLLTLEHTD